MKHHLMVGTWTPPGAIFSFEFDDERLELRLLKRTEIPREEPISWMALSVSRIEQQNDRIENRCADCGSSMIRNKYMELR